MLCDADADVCCAILVLMCAVRFWCYVVFDTVDVDAHVEFQVLPLDLDVVADNFVSTATSITILK